MANLKKHEIIHIRDMINSDKTPQEKYSQHIHFKKKQHVRIHKREKKFACKYCEKRFTQSHSVKGGLISEIFLIFVISSKKCA